MPRYLKKDGEYLIRFSNQQCRINDQGVLIFPKKMELEVKTRFDSRTDLREVQIVPRGIGYDVKIVYKKEVEYYDIGKKKEVTDQTILRIMGIDIGLRNLVTIGNNFSANGMAVRAGLLKSINANFNECISNLLPCRRWHENQC